MEESEKHRNRHSGTLSSLFWRHFIFTFFAKLKTGEMDEEIIKLLDSGKRTEAISLKKQVISLLQEAAELNPEGFAPTMLKAAEKTLKQMESNRNDNKVRKGNNMRFCFCCSLHH